MNTSKNFKINQSKIFLNNSSFLKLENENDDDSIIEKDFDLEGTQQNLLKLSFTSKNQPQTAKSKLNKKKQQQIPASAIYSTAMHLKSDLEKEFLKNNNLLKDRKNSSLSSDKRQEVLTVLQYPIQLKNKNDNLNRIPPELSFLKFDDIEKVNSSFLGNDKKCLSLPKLYRKFEILKSQKQNPNYSNEKSFWNEPKTLSPSKMALDIEITHNKQVHKEISNLFNKQREDSFARVESKRNDYRKQLLKLPIIRSYPTVKVKNISYKMAKELEDFDSKEGGLVQSTVSSDKNTKNITKDKPFRIYWQLKEIYTWKPEVRESASFILDGRKGYLYGGLGTRIMDDVLCIDFDLMQWSKIPDSGDKYTMGKYGHTAVKYKKKMIVYGGGTSYQSQLRQKECLGEVRVLNLDDFSWNWIKCSGDIITPRRHHTAEVIGKHMIVHGGINYKNVVLNDLWIFDLSNLNKKNLKNL